MKVLNERFLAVCEGRSGSTYSITARFLRSFEQWWPCDGKIEVGNVRASQLEEWLALSEGQFLDWEKWSIGDSNS